jgi:hypothetical protein
MSSALHANSVALSVSQVLHALRLLLKPMSGSIRILPTSCLAMISHGGSALRRGDGEGGILRCIEPDPDCFVPPVNPPAYMLIPDLVTGFQCG